MCDDDPWSVSDPACRRYWKEKCYNLDVEGKCLEFMKQELNAGRNTMDDSVLQYCKRNRTDKHCSCINFDTNSDKYKIMKEHHGPMHCWYSMCSNPDAFMTLSMYKSKFDKCKSKCLVDDVDFFEHRAKCNTALKKDSNNLNDSHVSSKDIETTLFSPIDPNLTRHDFLWLTTPIHKK